MYETPGQGSAIDERQIRYAAQQAALRDARVHELWRWALTQKMGREFVWEVLLADVGYDQPVRGLYEPTTAFLSANAAMHNLGVHWMHAHIRRHRDLYLQMLNEASKREDEQQQREESARATWVRDEEDEP